MMNKKQKVILIVGIIFAVLLVSGGSYAFWMWTSNINKNVAFNTTNFEKNIIYNEGEAKFIGNFQPTDTFCESAHNTISFYKKIDLQDMNVSASIKMKVNSIGENIALSNDVYWVVTSGSSNIGCSDGLDSSDVLIYGTFNGVTSGQILNLINIGVDLSEQIYTVWIWIDNNGSNLSLLSGETIDTNIWTDFELLEKKEYIVNLDLGGGQFIDDSPVFEYVYTVPDSYLFNVPINGSYQLEVWGAQGGTGMVDGVAKYEGGYGGYSIGTIELNKGDLLSVNVGGKGEDALDREIGSNGGYNGGGIGGVDNNYSSSGGNEPGAGGGGATHIATRYGFLSYFENKQEKLLIVAGGGGGSTYGGSGGNGGGIQGNSGTSTSTVVGTQISGNAFGVGGNGGANSSGAGGGGGGYYGGGGGAAGSNATGGGGSGYIGNNLLVDKLMYCYNCTTSDDLTTLTYSTTNVSDTPISNYAKIGDGAAKITLFNAIGVKFGDEYGNLPIPVRSGYTFLGWFTEPDGGIEVTEDTIMQLHDSHKLYARWIYSGTYYIKYNLNGGSGISEMQLKNEGESISLFSDIPTKDGYKFLGWSTSSTATSSEYQPGDTYSIDDSLILYAVWTPITMYLYNSGEEYIDITGGWGALYKTNSSYWLNATVTKESTYLRISAANSSAPRWASIMTVNKVDVSNYDSLNFNVTAYKKSATYGYISILVMTERLQDGGSYVISQKGITGTGIVSLDISSLDGAYYIGFYAAEEEESTAQISVDSIYLN